MENQNQNQITERKKVKVMVFTSPTCPHCPSAVVLAKKKEKEYKNNPEIMLQSEELSSLNPKAMRLAQKYNVMSTPTLIFKNENGELLGKIGTPSEKTFDKMVRVSAGLEEESGKNNDEKKSIFSKIKKIFGGE